MTTMKRALIAGVVVAAPLLFASPAWAGGNHDGPSGPPPSTAHSRPHEFVTFSKSPAGPVSVSPSGRHPSGGHTKTAPAHPSKPCTTTPPVSSTAPASSLVPASSTPASTPASSPQKSTPVKTPGRVTAPRVTTPASVPALAVTGSDGTERQLAVGGLAVLSGAGLLLGVRRRTQNTKEH